MNYDIEFQQPGPNMGIRRSVQRSVFKWIADQLDDYDSKFYEMHERLDPADTIHITLSLDPDDRLHMTVAVSTSAGPLLHVSTEPFPVEV